MEKPFLIITKSTWKTALRERAIQIMTLDGTFGYKVLWYLWAADVWYGKFPLLKFIILMNILVWFLLWYFS